MHKTIQKYGDYYILKIMKEEWELNNQEQKQNKEYLFQMWSKDKSACVRHGTVFNLKFISECCLLNCLVGMVERFAVTSLN